MTKPKDPTKSRVGRRALLYLDRKGRQLNLASLYSRVEETFRTLEEVLASIDPEATAENPEGGGWSVFEVVDHLIESHRPAVLQLEKALRGENPGPAIPAHLQSENRDRVGWNALLADLEQIHVDYLAALKSAVPTPGTSSDHQEQTPPIPIVMVLKDQDDSERVALLEWEEPLHWKSFVAAIRVHTLEHLAQIDRILGEPKD